MGLRHTARSLKSPSTFSSRVILTAGTNVVMAILGLATGTLAARLLGPEGRGELAAIQLWPTAVALVMMLGLPDALVFFAARHPGRAASYLISGSLLLLLIAVPVSVAAYFALPIVLPGQSAQVIDASRIYLLIIPLFVFSGMPMHYLRGRDDFARWNVLRPLPNIGWLVILLIAWSQGMPDPMSLAMAYLAATALVAIIAIGVVARQSNGPVRVHRTYAASMLRYGIPSGVSNLPSVLNLKLDQMLIASLFPPRALGTYVVAVAFSNAMQPLISAIGQVLFPSIAAGTEAASKRTLVKGVRGGLALTSITTVAAMLATPFLFSVLFGDDYGTAISTATVLAAAGGVLAFNMILQDGVRGAGRPKLLMWSELAGALVTALALLFLLEPFGIRGAALASFLGYSAVAAMLLTALARIASVPLLQLIQPDFRSLRDGIASVLGRRH